MHKLTGKHARERLPDRELEQYGTAPRHIRYHPPMIFSSTFGVPLHENHLKILKGSEAGAYEVKACGDGVKAYAVLWVYNDPALSGIEAINHGMVCHIVRRLAHLRSDFGRFVLGGGFVIADYDLKRLMVFGRSGDYGRLPESMQLGLFAHPPFKVHLAGYGNDLGAPGPRNMRQATEWYLSNGIEVDDK